MGKKTKTGLIFTKTSYLYCTIITVFSRTQINNLENQPNNPVIPAPFLKILILKKNKKQKNSNKQTNKKSLHNFFYYIQQLIINQKAVFLRIIFSGPHDFRTTTYLEKKCAIFGVTTKLRQISLQKKNRILCMCAAVRSTTLLLIH